MLMNCKNIINFVSLYIFFTLDLNELKLACYLLQLMVYHVSDLKSYVQISMLDTEITFTLVNNNENIEYIYIVDDWNFQY